MSITADHHGFYRDGQPFFPQIQERGNVCTIRLPARLSDDLDWSAAITQAHENDALILWEIDLGLDHMIFDPQDTLAFFSFTLALEEFTKNIWPAFKERTFGVSLYRGKFNPEISFPLSKWEEGINEDYLLFCAQYFAEYLHRLVSFLPDEVLPFAFLDVSSLATPAKTAQLFSKARFEHLNLILKGAEFSFGEGESSAIGIYLPTDSMIDDAVLAQLDQIISKLRSSKTLFRILPEEKLTEQWDGLDELIVPSELAISPQGRRKLLGFTAAGGTVTIATLE